MPTLFRCTALALVACLTSAALAQGRRGQPPQRKGKDEPEEVAAPTVVAIGERAPELAAAGWANYSGTPKLDRFRGHVVVLFFFRSDDASGDAISTLNDANQTFSRLGVVFIGLTPQKKEQAETLVKGKDVKFIIGYGVDTAGRYEVSAYPKVYLLDTDGVLVQRFHPGDDFEDRLRSQLRKTPPTGADEEGLSRRLEQAKTALKDEAYGKAYTLAQDVNKLADKDSALGKAAADLMKKIEDAARKWLEEARTAAKTAAAPNTKDADREAANDKACRILAELSVRFSGTDVGKQADDEIGRLMGDARLKTKLRTALDSTRGELLNEQAAEEEANGRYLEAFRLYGTVTEEHPDTNAAKTADQALDRLRTDPKLKETIKNLRADDEAERWLDIGDRFSRLEMYGKAREYYERIVALHPSTAAGPKAKERLARLPEEKPEEGPPVPAEEDEGDETPGGAGE
jgi:peroxiredoxin/tetratricopeptide (TPR) repeat protein